ncbi:MAG TPA: response regulator transcription factor [Actinopolymorphaceae bacterium]|mgnify:CR=1 FL=1|jgi:DNA-binding NarL/FixJ family response regulator
MIDVLVVDDHPVVREGLAAMLRVEPDINVVGEAGDGAEALAMATRLRPHVVLMDLRMPRLDGAGATARLAVEVPETKVLVLTTYDTDTDIMRAVEAGATGYLLKDTPRPQLVEAVRAAARGETILAPPVAAKLVDRMRVSSSGTPAPVLTKRQLEVLSLVAEGHTNAEIGRRLHIGESTVKTHLLEVFAKLGVDDRTHAVTVALKCGLLPPPRREDDA